MLTAVISNGEVCIPLLQFLRQHGLPVLLFSELDDPGARPMVEAVCASYQIPLQYGNDNVSLYEWLAVQKPTLVFVSGYNKRIDVASLPGNLANHIFNIHPGILPAYRGPSPVFWQLKEGAKEIGLCIHRLTPYFDAGPILWEKKIPREEHFTYTQFTRLSGFLALEGVGMILQQLLQQQPLRELPQDTTKARYHKRPSQEDVTIRWPLMSADEIVRLVNACNGWNKGALTLFKGSPCKIIDAYKLKVKSGPGVVAGTITQLKDECWVACGNQEILSVTHINFDGNFVPARLFEKYGFRKGDRFE